MKDNMKKPDGIDGAIFDLKDLSLEEMKEMFMGVSVKSLDNWMSYFEKKEQYEICSLIKEIKNFKNGQVEAIGTE